MAKKDKSYSKITEKIDMMEDKICEIRDSLSNLKNTFSKKAPPENLDDLDDDPEICYDEIEADMAAYEAIRDICLESMLGSEPVGEA